MRHAGPDECANDEAANDEADSEAATSRRRRRLVLHVHLSELALHNAGDGLATLKTPAGHQLGVVTVEQVQGWCAADGAQVTVRPTLDTTVPIESAGYQPSRRLRDLVVSLNPRCVFPHCTRPADNLDLDHIIEHNRGGPTSSDNLAPLCRRHHRAKTHTSWTYTRLADGEYLWRSPHGYAFVTDPEGTRDVSLDSAGKASHPHLHDALGLPQERREDDRHERYDGKRGQHAPGTVVFRHQAE